MKHKHSIEPMASFLNWLNVQPRGAITEQDVRDSFQRNDTNELTWIIKQFADERCTDEEVEDYCSQVFTQLSNQFPTNADQDAARSETNSPALSHKEYDRRSHDASKHFKSKQSNLIKAKASSRKKDTPQAHTSSKNTYSARMWQSQGSSVRGMCSKEALAELEDTGYQTSWRGNR